MFLLISLAAPAFHILSNLAEKGELFRDNEFKPTIHSLFLASSAQDLPTNLVSRYKKLIWRQVDEGYILSPATSRVLRCAPVFNSDLASVLAALITWPNLISDIFNDQLELQCRAFSIKTFQMGDRKDMISDLIFPYDLENNVFAIFSTSTDECWA